ncbi:MAG: triose-phosphate isomerase [Henriciella sp.]|nr:triose-phosphate isomerase [Henriciella sp.]
MVRTLIAGNWKMNGLNSSLKEVEAIVDRLSGLADGADILLCPPATMIGAMASMAGDRLKVGGQCCHNKTSGAHTGDISAEMLVDAGATYVIVGHSERRDDHAERSAYVKSQAGAALRAGLVPIVCVGEEYAQRKRGETAEVIERIMRKSLPEMPSGGHGLVVAYEPKWAIGTGEIPTMAEIGEVHALIRKVLVDNYGMEGLKMPILYGGSMKPGNAAEILAVADVNGGLIGGASLKADDFMSIYEAAIN